ncbi:MANS1 protein, partial [Psilopogon haemacephalus]|nr:MANS1 protein [Psilopogon haemacephalus]
LVVITCVMAGPSLSAECPAEKMENSIIDINLSLPRGVRGAEPLHAPSPASCVHACCSGKKLSGDKKCNLLIFDARRTSMQPNCYLFYCPSAEACPMKPAAGLISYKITRDSPVPEGPSFRSEYFSSDEHSLSSDDGSFIPHGQPGHQNHEWPHEFELQNHVGKQLDHSEFHTVLPESQGAKHLESLDPIPRQNLPPNMSSAVQIGTLPALFSTTQSRAPELSSTASASLLTSATQLQSHTTSLPTGDPKPTALTTTTTTTRATSVTTGAKPGLPVTSIAVTHVPLSGATTATSSITKQVTTNSRSATALSRQITSAIPAEPTVVFLNHTSYAPLLPSGFTLSTRDSLTSSQNNPGGYDPSDSESYPLESILRGKGVIQLGEESSLIAALLLGLIFLLLVIALTGKKMYESLQKRHYTRLDYLINGMYADV